MPDTYFPHTAQAGICGNMEDVESVSCESSSAVKVAVSAAAFTSKQTDSHMSRRAWSDKRSLIILTITMNSEVCRNFPCYQHVY